MVQICLVSVHILYEILDSTLFMRGCVNGCCGWEVVVLWLVVSVSSQPASVSPRGAIACFLPLDGRGNGCESVEGQGFGVWVGGAYLLLIAPPLYVVDLFQQ